MSKSNNPHLTPEAKAAAKAVAIATKDLHPSTACILLGSAIGVIAMNGENDMQRFANLGQAVMSAGNNFCMGMKKKGRRRG